MKRPPADSAQANAAGDRRSAPGPVRSAVLWTVIGVVLWIAFLSFPLGTASDHLDPSWMQALGYALKNEIQAGTELVFVYSPIGYLLTSVYDRDLFGTRVVWELMVGAALAVVLTAAVRRTPGRARKTVLFCVVVLFVPYQKDPLYLLGIVAATALLLRNRTRPVHVAAGLPFLALVSAPKFTYLMFVTVCVLAVAIAWWRRRSAAHAAFICAAFALCFVGVWALFGQSPGNIPAFLATSLDVTGGYNEAMVKSGATWELVLGFVLIVASLGLLWRPKTAGPMGMNRILLGIVVTAGFFLVWKHGFVRQDKGHVLVFFTFVMAAPHLFVRSKRPDDREPQCGLTGTVLYAITTLALVGFFLKVSPQDFVGIRTRQIVHGVRSLASFDELRARLEEDRQGLRRLHDLPTIRATVGENTVDLVSYEQGVLLLNDLNYHPRPLLQSCSAYTPRTLGMDARFFRGADAPAFVIFRLQTIDRRLPSVDDCDALRVILRDYVPVLVERGYILFKRGVEKGICFETTSESVRRGTVPLGESIDLASLRGNTHFLSLRIEYSILGRLAGLLYKPPPIYLEVQADDDTHYRFRIPRGMVRTGFIIDPLMRDQTEFLSWYLGRTLKRPRSVRPVVDRGTAWMFQRNAELEIESYDAVVPEVGHAVSLAPLCFMFKTPPYSVRSIHPPDCWEVHGEKVLVVHAPGTIHLRTGGGLHRLAARYGVVPGAYEGGRTDGVLFKAKIVRDGKEQTLFERYLDPVDEPEDRGFQQLAVRFRTKDSVDVVLETDTGPRGDDGWDWSFWTDVEIYAHPVDS